MKHLDDIANIETSSLEVGSTCVSTNAYYFGDFYYSYFMK